MEPPHKEQYSQESNPREYMTMRDYRNLAWKNQQPLGRNPNPNRSMRDYRDQWKSAHVYSVPSTYPPPPHPQYASLSQPQPSQPISLVEQAILDLTKLVGDVVEEQKKINAQLSQKIDNMENNVNKRIDGLQGEMEQKLDNLQYSISKLAQHLDHPEEESQEEECLTKAILVEQDKLQPQRELKVESAEAPEELQDALESSVAFWPRRKEEEITALLTAKSSGHEAVEVPKKNVIQPNPIDLDTTATAQDTKYPLPVAPSVDQVYILPSPAPQPTPAANSKPTAPKAKSNPLSAMQKFRKLMAIAQAFATTSKKMANAYIAWHSGWFGCGFGFGAPGPRHF